MDFTLLPAIDVAGGRVTRTAKGSTAVGDPLTVALGLQRDGARWIHLVDLDAAFNLGSNADLLASVVDGLDIKVELSGGVHDDGSLQRALASGCERVIIGTEALKDLSWCARMIDAHGERIAISLDVLVTKVEDNAPRHQLAARGGASVGGDLWETLAQLDQTGCARYVVTDVTKDGTLSGPNVDLYRDITRATTTPVVASGGISSIADLVVLAEAAAEGMNLEGSIVGRALHVGRFSFIEALQAVEQIHRP